MNSVEKRLADEKSRMDSITAPEELEMRLRSALNTSVPRRTKRISPSWKIAAVILLGVIIFGNNYNALAYYGKQLLGFDELIQGTLKQLNDEGRGQIVEKKTTLEDGTDLIINGILSDANQLVMYYSLTNPNGLEDPMSGYFSPTRISGFLTNSNIRSGSSVINENHTEIKGMQTFDSVSPFSKELTLHFFWQSLQNGQRKEGTISFPYDPNKAMQTQIKQAINKTFTVDKGTITFNSITATPTLTLINGTLHVENFSRVNSPLGGIELRANGTPVALQGSGSQSSLTGMKFDIRYDSLPKQLHSLELVMKEFVGYQILDAKLSLTSFGDGPLALNSKELRIKNVSKTTQGVEITIATDDDVMLDGVSVQTHNEITPLKTTVNQNNKQQTNGRIMKERTLLFDTTMEPEYLLIKGMHYMKAYNKVIEIPVD